MEKVLEFKRTMLQIDQLRRDNHDFRTIKKEIGEDNLRELFRALYPALTLLEIEKVTHIPDSTLGRWYEMLDIPLVMQNIITKAFPGKKDSELIIIRKDRAYKLSKICITPELAYLIGFTLGDGAVQKYMVEVFNKDYTLREYLLKILEKYGTVTKEIRSNGLWRLRLSSGKIANLIKNKSGIREDTIDHIFGNDDLARQFIAAFWDAEGSLGKRKNYNYFDIVLYNSNEYILNQIINFLNKKEINCTLKYFKEIRKNYTINKRIILSNKKVFRLRILKNSQILWVKEIGIFMEHSKKIKIVKDILKTLELS